MTASALVLLWVVGGIVSVLLAALLVLADRAPTAGHVGPAGAGATRLFPHVRLVLIMIAGVCGGMLTRWWERSILEAALVGGITLALVFVAAFLLPRSAARVLPGVARAALPLAIRLVTLFRPVQQLTVAAERFFRRAMPDRSALPVGADERDMLVRVLSLQDEVVADVMTPRLDIESIEASATWPQVVEALRHGEHARVPVYGNDPDDIVGILYAKDVTPFVAGLATPPDPWQTLVRAPQFVPESKRLTAQLRDFQRGPSHLAVVVDEFGGTAGLVSLEDVLEEVVGEIRGEYDADEEAPYTREGDDRFWVDGAVTVDELADLLQTDLGRDDVATVGGLVYSELGRVPRPGEELRMGPFRVVVEKVVQRRIRRVYFERVHAESVTPSVKGETR